MSLTDLMFFLIKVSTFVKKKKKKKKKDTNS
jgi:hypothetical protein